MEPRTYEKKYSDTERPLNLVSVYTGVNSENRFAEFVLPTSLFLKNYGFFFFSMETIQGRDNCDPSVGGYPEVSTVKSFMYPFRN